MQYLSSALGQFFEFIHSGIAFAIVDKNFSYGIAIIVFTVIIRIILLPLNIKQTNSQIKMTEIQPEVKKLQAKYKNDPQKANEEMMKLYKEKGVNPMGGCLPLIIQMPILFALFYVFRDLKTIEGVKFLWIPNLAAADPYYVLPILSGLTTYFSSSMMAPKDDSAQAKQTSIMNIVMGIFLTFMSIQFRAALVLYWVANNIIQILQTYFMKKMDKNIVKEA